MRCNKCGYDGAGNVPGGTCIKCGTRLNINGPAPISRINPSIPNEANDSQSRPTMVGINVSEEQNLKATRIVGAPDQKSPLKKTVVQGMVPGVGDQMKSTVVQNMNTSPTPSPLHVDDSGELVCPRCGYPLADQYSSCPNCGADFSDENDEEQVAEDIQINESQAVDSAPTSSKKERKKKKQDESMIQKTVGISALKKAGDDYEEEFLCTCENCGEEISATFRFCPKCGSELRQRTQQGFHHKKRKDVSEVIPQPTIKKEFKLTIIPEEDENIESAAIHFEGAEIVLNRKNTEPDNLTITSKEQAVVYYELGKWYIENRSEYGSTLILANRKLEIQNGDIIMLGDRRFKFESEESEQK